MTTKTLGLTGRNYATLAAYASYVNALSLAADEICEVYNDGEIVETASIILGGWTANGFNVIVRPAAGQGFKDHASANTNPYRYNASVGAAIRSTYDNATAVPWSFEFSGANLQIRDLQFCCDAASTNVRCYRVSNATASVEQCIFAAYKGNDLFSVSQAATLRNLLIYARNLDGSAKGFGASIAGVVAENLTIAKVGTSANTGATTAYAYYPTIKNTVLYGWSTDFSGTFNTNCTNNATSKASFGGTNAGTSGQTSVVAGDFISVTSGSEDFRIASGSTKLRDRGATLGSVTVDGMTFPRTAPYNIGAYEDPPTPIAPSVTTHPSAQSVVTGTPATFTAAFAGYPTPTYQWERSTDGGTNWSGVSGATSASYTTPATTISGGSANNNDKYRCVATNASGSATTNAALLTVSAGGDTTPPTLSGTLTASGITQTGFTVDGPTATDDVAVTGYDWSSDGGATYPVIGWPAPSYTFSGLTAGTTYGIRMRARDAAGNLSSVLSLSVTTLVAGGTLSSSPLKLNTGALHLSAPFEAYVYNTSTGALVIKKTGLTSHASTGVVTFTDAALSTASNYRVIWRHTGTGALGVQELTAS